MGGAVDLLIRGGTVVTADRSYPADVAVTGGRIAAVGPRLPGPAVREIDVTGRLVIPGGVDPHAHLEQRSGAGLMNADTFESAHRAALLGGTTTVVSFAAQPPGTRPREAVADYAARAARGALADHAFHLIVADPSHLARDLPALAEAGHRSLKLFTTYPAVRLDDRQLIEVMVLARRHGALCCIHAETDALLSWTRDALLARGLTQPPFHAVAHPRLAEIDAVERMIRFAEFTGARIMLFHISTAEAAEAVRRAKARGLPVHAETCPHYLLTGPEVLDRPDGAKWMCSPPQRDAADRAALWAALEDGTIDLVSSDHAPYRMDASGKLAHGADAPFDRIANGMPGLEPRMALVWDALARRGLPPELFVRLTAEAPARLHGLPGKGRIEGGADADLVIWTPEATRAWGADDLHDNAGYNPWEGHTTKGAPETVILGGRVAVEGGRVLAAPGSGRFLPRPPFPQGTPAEEARIALGETP
jgi:dihydropyrimidinase